MAAIVAPWVISVQNATAGQFIPDSLAHDLLPKLVGAQESHGAPPGYYLAVVIASFWPGSLFIVPGLVWGWRRRRDLASRFLLAWLGPAWVFFELVPTKLPHYILPLYPAVALLAGGALAEGFVKRLTGPAWFADTAVRMIWGVVTILGPSSAECRSSRSVGWLQRAESRLSSGHANSAGNRGTRRRPIGRCGSGAGQ